MSYNMFEEYKREGKPNEKQRAENWAIAIGLQQVDNLTPSDYLIETAKENVEGKITIEEVKQRIDSYYKTEDFKVKEKILSSKNLFVKIKEKAGKTR